MSRKLKRVPANHPRRCVLGNFGTHARKVSVRVQPARVHKGAGGRWWRRRRRRRGWWWRCGGRRWRCRGWGGRRRRRGARRCGGRRRGGRRHGGGHCRRRWCCGGRGTWRWRGRRGVPANGRGGGGRCVGGVGRVATTGHQRASQRHGGHSLEYPAPGREIRAVVQFLVHCFGRLGWAECRAFWSFHRQFKANVVPGRAPCEKWAVCRVLCPAPTGKNGEMNNLVSPILSLK